MVTVTLYNTCEGIIASVNIIGNGIVLVAILKHRHLHTPTNVFIGHLAAADVLAGVPVGILAITTAMNLDMNFHSCILLNTVLVLFANASIIMLLCVTCERYAAIRYPFKYNQILDVRCANYMALTAWATGVVTGLMPMFGWNKGAENYGSMCSFLAVICYDFLVYFEFVFLFLVPISLMTCVYAYIGRVARRHRRASNSLYSRFNVQMQKNARTAKSFVVLIAVMFVLKLPLHLLNCMKYYDVNPPWSDTTESRLILITILLSRSNSMVNPFIYAGSNSKIKAAMKNVAFCRPIQDSERLSFLISHVPPHNITDADRTDLKASDFPIKKGVSKNHSIQSTACLSVTSSYSSPVDIVDFSNKFEKKSCRCLQEDQLFIKECGKRTKCKFLAIKTISSNKHNKKQVDHDDAREITTA